MAYKGLKVSQAVVDDVVEQVMNSRHRVARFDRNQQGIEVIDIFDPVSGRGIRLIRETMEFDTFINW